MWFRSGFCKPSFRQLCRYKCNYHVLPSSSLHFDSAGHSLALLTQPHTPLSKTDSTSSKRDSFSAVSKEQTYLDSSGILLGGEEETVSERLKDWCVLIFFPPSIHFGQSTSLPRSWSILFPFLVFLQGVFSCFN